MLCEENESEAGPGGWECPRPPFPIFPVVVPLIFPFGVMAMLIRRGRRRRRTLEARVSEVEKELAALTEKVSAAEGEQ
jgi:hypothetical protein